MPDCSKTSQIIRVRRALRDAPGTAFEIAAELGISVQQSAVYLGRLHKLGLAERRLAPGLAQRVGRKPHLYSLRAG